MKKLQVGQYNYVPRKHEEKINYRDADNIRIKQDSDEVDNESF